MIMYRKRKSTFNILIQQLKIYFSNEPKTDLIRLGYLVKPLSVVEFLHLRRVVTCIT